MMDRAKDSIDSIDSDNREISGTTVALSKKGFKLFKTKIQQLRSELLELSAEESDPTRIVQFNFQAFPLASSEDENL